VPTYSYRCANCDFAFDQYQAFTDDSLTVCPNCGGTLRKLFSAVGVSFTGSGFYRNDSRAPAPSEGSSAPAAPAAAAAPKSDSGSSSTSTSPSTSSPTPAAPATTTKKE
jgi:putative FmdB family regulatory protein